MAGKTSYTVKEVEAYKKRMFREHIKEFAEISSRRYAEGYESGKRDMLNNLRSILGLPDIER